MDNPETSATWDTRHRTMTNETKKHNTENYKDQQHGHRHGRHQHGRHQHEHQHEHEHGRHQHGYQHGRHQHEHQHQHLGWPLVLAKGNELLLILKIVWRNQRGNQNPYIQEEQTTQWSIEKAQKDKQRSTKHTHKLKIE